MLIVLADTIFPDCDIERDLLAEAGHELVVADSPDHAVELFPKADGVLTCFLDLSAARIKSMTQAKIIARYGIGVDNVDLAAACDQGIVVTNVPDYCVEEVATHTVAMLLSMLRKLPEADRHVRSGGWGVDGVRPLRRLSELTIGLIGFGRIGQLVAETLAPLGPKLLASDPYAQSMPDQVKLVPQAELLEASDAVLLHAPLTAATAGLINADTLKLMRPGALLVNASRGGLVDLAAVTSALHEGRLGGAALDVFPTEPVDPAAVADVPNLHLSSHIAYYSEEALQESQRKAATQIVRVLAGLSPEYPVNLPDRSK